MPRSLASSRRAMPDVELIPYPRDVAQASATERWWLHSGHGAPAVLRVREDSCPRPRASASPGVLAHAGTASALADSARRLRSSARVETPAVMLALDRLSSSSSTSTRRCSWCSAAGCCSAPRRWAMEGLRLHGLASLWLAEGDLRHALRGARAREAAQGRLPRRVQAPVGVGHVRADPGVPRSGHGAEGRARLDPALRLVLPQVRAHLRPARQRSERAQGADPRRARSAPRRAARSSSFPKARAGRRARRPTTSRAIIALYEGLGLPCVPLALNSGLFWPRRSIRALSRHHRGRDPRSRSRPACRAPRPARSSRAASRPPARRLIAEARAAPNPPPLPAGVSSPAVG